MAPEDQQLETQSLRPTSDAGPPSSDESARRGRFIPGEMFGRRYRIVALLGTGGMGEVYRADDLELGQAVAIKLLPERFANDPIMIGRLKAEVRVARQIAHPDVVRVYDIGQLDEHYFLTMEYIDGEDLASVLRRLGRPSIEKALQIARQICAGLAAAHELGVLHRDLKPANVLIDGRGRARLTDFGLAHLIGDALGPDARVGTPAFMSPEQLATGQVTIRSDVYTLGLLLYELFTGQRYFKTGALLELKKLHAADPPATLSTPEAPLPSVIERLILRCLQRDPQQRPESAAAVGAALPGGDTLTVAVAAGETPSPEMVAAAGGAGGLSVRAGLGWLGIALVGLAAVALLSERTTLFGLARPAKPPAVLVDRARTMLSTLGQPPPADAAWGFTWDAARARRVADAEGGRGAWRVALTQRPTVYCFWYRESDAPMVPLGRGAIVTAVDPPRGERGAFVELDAAGRLTALELAPREEPNEEHVEACNWRPLLAAAEVESKAVRRSVLTRATRQPADERLAWDGALPGASGEQVHVEGAALRGQPTYFRVSDMADDDAGRAPPPSFVSVARDAVRPAVELTALIASAIVARRQLRAGRGDRRGALRFGVFAFLLQMCQLVALHYVPDPAASWSMLLWAMSERAFVAAWWAMGYFAFEPFVRRMWPTLLISWARLLAGRVRDRRVGRDVLIGVAAGVGWTLVQQASVVLGQWLGDGGLPGAPDNAALLGGLPALARFANGDFLAWSMLVGFSLIAALFVVRRRWLAGVFAWLVMLALQTPAGLFTTPTPAAIRETLAAGVIVAGLLVLTTRVGMLGLVAASFVAFRLRSFPITLDAAAWCVNTSTAVLAFIAALALLTFAIAVAPRPRPLAIGAN